MQVFIRKYKYHLLVVVMVLIIVSGTAVTHALWEEKLNSEEEITHPAGVWNESEKYINFVEIREGGIVKAYGVAGYDGLIDNVEIPRSHLGKPVTTIKSTFVNDSIIKEIILPDTVVIIESNAFINFTNLKKVVIKGGEKTLTIGEYAFMNCGLLTELYMDDNRLLSIADTAFFNTAGITKPRVYL